MYCKNCGSEIQEGGNFCPRCGAAQNGSPEYARQNTSAQTPPPNNHMVKSIIGLFLCWPFALAALIFSSKVDDMWRSGCHEQALNYSRKANLWGNVSLIIGIASIVLVVIFWILVGTFAVFDSTLLYDI